MRLISNMQLISFLIFVLPWAWASLAQPLAIYRLMALIPFLVFPKIQEHVKLWVVPLNFLLLKREGWTENANLRVRMNGNWNHKIIQETGKLKSEHIGLTEILWVLELGHHEQLVTTKRIYWLNHSNYYSRLVCITETMLMLSLSVSAATWHLPSRSLIIAFELRKPVSMAALLTFIQA